MPRISPSRPVNAAACVFAGFPGPEPPDWLRRRLQEGLGGVVLFAWNVADAEQVAGLTAALRGENPAVVVAVHEEGGDVTRLEAATGSSYPGNLALGTFDDVELTRRVATALGSDLRTAGIDLDLAPVADLLANPASPIVGVRSFGSEPELVARHVAAFVTGLQAAGVAACAKHFPGHGEAAEDSHVALPVVEDLRPEALLPFRAAIDAGVRAIMSAHLVVRSLDDAPATLSSHVLHDLLREELGFGGLVVTDALEMAAISATTGVGEAAVRAVTAGADAVCLGHDLGDDVIEEVMRALEERVPEERLAEAAARVAGVRVAGTATEDRTVGLEAARRALLVEGEPYVSWPPVVVEASAEPTIVAGDVPSSLGALIPRVGAQGRHVVVLRDAHRHPEQRALAEAHPDAVVVETGVPAWRPPTVSAYVATFGAGRVNLLAAVERLREANLAGAWIGDPKPLDGEVVLAEYDPRWPELYACEEERIRAALGGRALLVEHVGSTSVPGLPAKPIVDIVLAVEDSADEPSYAPQLEAAGYVLRIREPDWFEHRAFKGPDTDVNLHVFTAGSAEIERMLAFRDHLRADVADRELYLRTKRDLAARTWRYVQHYADAKSEVVEEILARALAR
ncbi:MAG: GrpB family protein [Thermoleophilia bacterium]|nr:GrpB family protein [Thermoleophilia bacterium]